ncbi:hypothetical protein KVR01_002169 [Diaporthe batatas]|uniref:uncharacterized protein n=1 Tax=Diaporthe batatas TaxID=748121 RepID=UPI001D04AF73|nr:uncharacterized protein KVR01_002169 [Diaporthe batatas]KAG8166480.1 hypothetical protein KVR01_002169 [Diaporthe batatas]
MQSVQRKFGRLLGRSPGDNAKVSVLLNDYEDADRILAKLIESAKSWQESWFTLVNSQLEIANVYASLYDPIVGASDGHGRQTAITPELQLHRTFALKDVYSDLRTELTEDIASIEPRVIQPANNARQSIAPIRKTIKKREDKRLDVEKTQDKVHKLHRKATRTPKEDAQLAKAEDDLASLTEEFEIADHHLRETLPPIIQATFSLVPPLLATHIVIQNRLLGLYYTVLHGYCEENDFPSPAPPMDEVIAVWANSFEAGKRDVESISIIARGRGIREPLNLSNDGAPLGRQLSAPPPEPGMRRASSGLIPSANGGRPRIASSNSAARTPSPQPSPNIGPRPDVKNPNYGGLLKPTDFTTASDLGRSSGQVSPSQLRQSSAGDYFAGRNPPSPASTVASNFSQTSIAAKKKPPPPPPPKRIGSSKPEEYVIAQYDFTGQGAGDLSFREGDRIKIVKKTQTDQDWWTGELAGVKGSFPANYCKPA